MTAPPRNQRFLTQLERLGFLVKTRRMQYEKDKAFGSDWDVGITVDAMSWQDQFDVFYLASGDGDYVPLLKKLKKLGKQIEVVTFRKTTSKLLHDDADRVTYLTSKVVFEDNRRAQNGD